MSELRQNCQTPDEFHSSIFETFYLISEHLSNFGTFSALIIKRGCEINSSKCSETIFSSIFGTLSAIILKERLGDKHVVNVPKH